MRYLGNDRGMALAIVLAVLLMLGFIGVAAIKNSGTDMEITRSMTDNTRAFYAAEAGLEVMLATMRANPTVADRDSMMALVPKDSVLGSGYFKQHMDSTYPIRLVRSTGVSRDGEVVVAIDVRHRRNPINAWNNAVFAGVGQSGKGIAGNVDIHGSLHILGDGEPFTDDNGNGQWDADDEYTDLNANGSWDPGEPLTVDHDGDGFWDAEEPYVDENGSGVYDETLTATDLSFEASGTAAVVNNYEGIPLVLSSRLPALETISYNGESVQTLDAEMRVKHGMVNLSGTASIGETNASGGSPLLKETMDGMYVNDGYGGTSGTANVHSDNGTSYPYDLGDGAMKFPSLSDSSHGYASHRDYLMDNALIISGNLEIKPGVAYTSPPSAKGKLSIDAAGNMSISGIVIVTGDVSFAAGTGAYKKAPIIYDGRGTVVSGGNMYINTSVLSRGEFPTKDAMGFLSMHGMEIGTGSGASQLNLMGAFFAQESLVNEKQNHLAGTILANSFTISNVPSFYQVPTLVDNLPPGLPGGVTIVIFVWQEMSSTWREL